MANPEHGKLKWVDTLRLSPRQHEDLLSFLDSATPTSNENRRADARLPFHSSAGLVVQMKHPGGSTITYLVRARNLSRTGIGFLHGSFVHTGTACILALRTTDGRPLRLEGKVHRCRHVRGNVHEIGVRFSSPVNPDHFIASGRPEADDPASDPNMRLPQFSGSVLHVESSENELELLRFHLETLGLSVRSATRAGEAPVMLMTHPFDLVVTDLWLPDMHGPGVIASLRQGGYAGPIFVLTADESEALRQQALQAGAKAVLTKPYRFEELLQLLLQHLPGATDGTPPPDRLMSDLWPNPRIRPLILSFLQRLDEQVRDIGHQLAAADAGSIDALLRSCLDLKGSAGGYGYPPISHAAARLAQLSQDSAPADAQRRQFDELVRLCAAARVAVPQTSAKP